MPEKLQTTWDLDDATTGFCGHSSENLVGSHEVRQAIQ